MKKSRAQKDILYISISSFVLVVAWIGFNLHHAYITSTIEPDIQLQITPIDPKFDTETINKLKTREKIAPDYEFIPASSEASITPEPAISETPTASESGGESLPTNSFESLGQ